MSQPTWQSLVKLLTQHGHLSDDGAANIAKTAPVNAVAWLSAYFNQPNINFTATGLAQWMSETVGIPRVSPSEWRFYLDNRHNFSDVDLPQASQGLIWLGGSSACIGVVDAADGAVLRRLKFVMNAPFEWRILSLDEYQLAQQGDFAVASQRFATQTAPNVSTISLNLLPTNSVNSDDAPVVRYIQDLLVQMMNERASDVHFEPFSNTYRIRARIDGVLHDITELDVQLREQLSVRLKVMAQLDIAEKRLPQDGRMKLVIDATESVDCRISTLPTLFGEKIVVRFLNSQTTEVKLSKLGYEPHQLAVLNHALTHPYGLILMTGPTGSGKTVSLYACLNQLNTPQVNISTVEDPVEIFMTGINQVSINEKAGVDFATALRAFLRQDPDILMVGEIRDLETADIALKASQTGHLVFSTLHTNDAPLALTRLAQMGVTPYNIAASVSVIIAQRLVRLLCSCKKTVRLDETLLLSAGFSPAEAAQTDWQAHAPNGCARCHHTGFLGRTWVFQVLPISNDMQTLVAKNASAQDLREQSRLEGVLTLREAGLLKVKAGLCALEEVMAATL